jgi:hypothetical protein
MSIRIFNVPPISRTIEDGDRGHFIIWFPAELPHLLNPVRNLSQSKSILLRAGMKPAPTRHVDFDTDFDLDWDWANLVGGGDDGG